MIKLPVFTCIIFLVACDGGSNSGGQNKAFNSQPKISVPLQAGTEYKWFNDSSCTDRENEICVSNEDYKALCLSASGVSKMASRMLTNFNRRANYLLDNGDIDELSVHWKDGYKYGCRVIMQVSGMVQGSSARENLEGGVTGFIFNQDRKILAHTASAGN